MNKSHNAQKGQQWNKHSKAKDVTADAPRFVKAWELTEEMFKSLPRLKDRTQKDDLPKKGFSRCGLEIEIDKPS
ncbi:MAG: hypothetical protein MZU97_09820 [Bacillus subtilis]|nr:hypothetical protein [Bacillus subtilis]